MLWNKKGEILSAIGGKDRALMSLGIKCGETITVHAEGEDEQLAIDAVQAFFIDNKF